MVPVVQALPALQAPPTPRPLLLESRTPSRTPRPCTSRPLLLRTSPRGTSTVSRKHCVIPGGVLFTVAQFLSTLCLSFLELITLVNNWIQCLRSFQTRPHKGRDPANLVYHFLPAPLQGHLARPWTLTGDVPSEHLGPSLTLAPLTLGGLGAAGSGKQTRGRRRTCRTFTGDGREGRHQGWMEGEVGLWWNLN